MGRRKGEEKKRDVAPVEAENWISTEVEYFVILTQALHQET